MTLTVEEARENGWGDQAEAFVAWMKQVDEALVRLYGVGVDSLPDADHATMFEDGMTVEEAAKETWEQAW